ncbi:hypothetical protein OKW22_000121 [Bacilli bacterium PM5-3]|nr:hypothetical protein [Bacilli bacterium PM5-3]
MFRRDEDFDEVENYKRQRQMNEELVKANDDRFSNRNDYKKNKSTNDNELMDENKDFVEKEKDVKTVTEKRFENKAPNNSKKSNSNLGSVIVYIIIAIFCVGGFISGLIDDEYYEYSEDNTESTSLASGYLVENKKISSTEFVKLYKKAKKNRIKYDKATKNYLSGDYDKPHVVNTIYISNEYDSFMDKDYYCIASNKEDEDKEIYRCASVNIYEEMTQPADFVKAVEDEEFDLTDYTIYSSESKDIYYINGFYYSKELCDLIVKWEKNKKF